MFSAAPPEPRRAKRAAAVVAAAAFGVESATPTHRSILPPSPPSGSGKKSRCIQAEEVLLVTAAVSDFVNVASNIVDTCALKLEEVEESRAAGDALLGRVETRLAEALEDIEQLEEAARSRRSFLSAKGIREQKLRAVFDTRNQKPFVDSVAGRQQLSRAVQSLSDELLVLCVGRSDIMAASADGTELTASVVKRGEIVSRFLDHLFDEGDVELSLDRVLAHLPKKVQTYVRTLTCILSSLRKAFSVLKYCNGIEARKNYYILAAGIAPPVRGQREKKGMMRRVMKVLDLPRRANSVPGQQQALRAAWERLQAKKGPLEVGEAVECLAGCGEVEALHVDGRITVKTVFGKSVTYSSQGSRPSHLQHFFQSLLLLYTTCCRIGTGGWSRYARAGFVDAP